MNDQVFAVPFMIQGAFGTHARGYVLFLDPTFLLWHGVVSECDLPTGAIVCGSFEHCGKQLDPKCRHRPSIQFSNN